MPEENEFGQFKTAQDLLSSYKEIQGAFTKVSQENKDLKDATGDPEEVQRLKDENANLKEQQELANLQPPPATGGTIARSFDESWMENPEATISDRVKEELRLARIEDVLQAEDESNPEEYQERYAYVDMLARKPEFAQIAKTAAGVKKLFKEADKLRIQSLQSNSKKSLEFLLNDGEPLSDEQLSEVKVKLFGEKKQTKQTTDAYMPDGSTSTKTGSDTDQKAENDTKIAEAANKGDVDGVLDGMSEIFKAIQAE